MLKKHGLALLLLLFGISPSWAENACDKNLSETLNSALDYQWLENQFNENATEDDKLINPILIGVSHIDCIDQFLVTLETTKWNRDQISIPQFKIGLLRAESLLNEEPSSTYQQAKLYKTNKNSIYGDSLYSVLRHWAAEHGVDEAQYDRAQDDFNDGDDFVVFGLEEMASRGYKPALKDLIRRLLQGVGLKENIGAAWYWLKRAEQFEIDTSGFINKPHEIILKGMSINVYANIVSNIRKFGDINWNKIDLTPALEPTTSSVPLPLSDAEIKSFAEKFDKFQNEPGTNIFSDATDSEFIFRTTGINTVDHSFLLFLIKPLEAIASDFNRRKCNYLLASERIYKPTSNREIQDIERKILTVASFLDVMSYRILTGTSKCLLSVNDLEGAKAIGDVLEWVSELANMDYEKMEAVAAEYMKIAKPPDGISSGERTKEQLYYVLSQVISSISQLKKNEVNLMDMPFN